MQALKEKKQSEIKELKKKTIASSQVKSEKLSEEIQEKRIIFRILRKL